MSDSIAFDRAADFYDATRGFPPGFETEVGAFIARVGGFTSSTRVLEVGIGTGRIALPLASHVASITGVDIARPMMERLRQKQRDEHVHLIEGDATRQPIADAAFTAAVAVHVFHLIPRWKDAVTEVGRVLKPGAVLVNCWTENFHRPAWWAAWNEAIPEYRRVRFGLGIKHSRTFLDELGWRLQGEEHRLPYVYQQTPQMFIDQLRARTWSSTWDLTDEELERGVDAVTAAIHAEGAVPDEPLDVDATLLARAYLPPQ